MIDVNRKFQSRIADSMNRVGTGTAKEYFDASVEDFKTFEEKGIQAGLVSNWGRVSDSDEARQFITTNNYGPFLPELWPIITAWYPEFPLKELISVQDMEQDLAYIITSELLAGTNKADTFMGDKVETPSGLRQIKGRYPTGEIFGEELVGDALFVEGDDTLSALAYYPIMQDNDSLASTNVEVWDADKTELEATYTAGSVSSGILALLDDTSAKVGEIELATGVITITEQDLTTKLISVSYVWNIEYANDNNIPTIIEDMKMIPIQAKPQVLSMKWTIFSEFVKKKQFGIDIRTSTTKRVLDLLYQYQVRYVLDKMYNGATGGTEDLTIPVGAVDLNVNVNILLKDINKISHKIQKNTGRIEGNCIVTGNDLKAYFEALPDTFYKPEAPGKDYGFNGPRKIGKIGRYTIFYDDKLADDEAFMTYRGSEWYDAAAYYGVFLPIAPTDVVNININLRGAFVTMAAFRLDKPNAIIKLKIQ